MSYLEFLWSLCHRVFKLIENAQSDIYKLMTALANHFEKVRQDIYFTRAQYFISKCSADALIKHGEDIRFPKFDSETIEQYRARLLAAYETFKMGGTIPGMIKAFEAMGYPGIEIEEHFKTVGQEEWAVFSVITPLEVWESNSYSQEEMEKVIARLKPAHTLGVFRRLCFVTDSQDSLVDRDLLCS